MEGPDFAAIAAVAIVWIAGCAWAGVHERNKWV